MVCDPALICMQFICARADKRRQPAAMHSFKIQLQNPSRRRQRGPQGEQRGRNHTAALQKGDLCKAASKVRGITLRMQVICSPTNLWEMVCVEKVSPVNQLTGIGFPQSLVIMKVDGVENLLTIMNVCMCTPWSEGDRKGA